MWKDLRERSARKNFPPTVSGIITYTNGGSQVSWRKWMRVNIESLASLATIIRKKLRFFLILLNWIFSFFNSQFCSFYCRERSEWLYIYPHLFSSWYLIASVRNYINSTNTSSVGEIFRANTEQTPHTHFLLWPSMPITVWHSYIFFMIPDYLCSYK